jgi:Tol biopolymer transport system component
MRALALAMALGALALPSAAAAPTLRHHYDADPTWSLDSRLIAFSRDDELWVMRANGSGQHRVAVTASWAWSPDGTLVYTARGDLYRIGPDGAGRVQLTSGPADDEWPAVSPNGDIAFERALPPRHRYDVWVMAEDGSAQRPLTQSAADDVQPDWSPDGTSVVFASCLKQCRIVAALADGSGFRFLTRAQDSAAPKWSPAGDRIAFLRAANLEQGYAKLFVVRPDGSGLRRAQPAPPEVEARFGETQGFDWAPDGRAIAYAADSGFGPGRILLVANAGLRNPHPLIKSGPGRVSSDDDVPAWSPDGRTIAFMRYAGEPDGSVYGTIWKVGADGLRLRRLTRG